MIVALSVVVVVIVVVNHYYPSSALSTGCSPQPAHEPTSTTPRCWAMPRFPVPRNASSKGVKRRCFTTSTTLLNCAAAMRFHSELLSTTWAQGAPCGGKQFLEASPSFDCFDSGHVDVFTYVQLNPKEDSDLCSTKGQTNVKRVLSIKVLMNI